MPSKDHPPVLAISGLKKSGKTTLIEELLHILIGKGWKVGVIKQQHEPIQVDRADTDTYRYYQAGAAVLSYDTEAIFLREKIEGAFQPEKELYRLGKGYDLILAEGFKGSDLDKIWLLRKEDTEPDESVTNIIKVLAWTDERVKNTLSVLLGWLYKKHNREYSL